MEALFLLLFAVGFAILVFAFGYFPCLLVARLVQRPEAAGWPTVGVCLLLAALPLFFLVDWWARLFLFEKGNPETDTLAAVAPVFALLSFGLGMLLARRAVTRTWPQAALLAAAGLLGHLIVGWPHAYFPVYPKSSPQAYRWNSAGYHRRAAAKAGPVLQEYGIRLPPGYMVVGAMLFSGNEQNSEISHSVAYGSYGAIYNAEILVRRRAKPLLFGGFLEQERPPQSYDPRYPEFLEKESEPLRRCLERAGYRPVYAHKATHVIYLKQARVAALHGEYEDFIMGRIRNVDPDEQGFSLQLAAGKKASEILKSIDPSGKTIPGGHDTGVSCVAFSPDGKSLAVAGYDGTIRLWQVPSPSSKPVLLSGHEGGVVTLAFSPDSQRLASAGHDKAVRIWRLDAPGSPPAVLRGHEQTVSDLAFSPDGRMLASASYDKSVRLWRPDKPGQAPAVLGGFGGAVSDVSFSPDGKLLASASFDGTLRLWRPAALQAEPRVLRGHEGWPLRAIFSPDGKLLVSAATDRMSPDNRLLKTPNARTVLLWRIGAGQQEPLLLPGQGGREARIALSPDGKLLAAGDETETVRLWKLADPAAQPDVLPEPAGRVSQVAFSPDGRLLAASSDYGTVKLWRTGALGEKPAVLGGFLPGGEWQASHYPHMAFSPDGALLAAAEENDSVRIWRTAALDEEPLKLSNP